MGFKAGPEREGSSSMASMPANAQLATQCVSRCKFSKISCTTLLLYPLFLLKPRTTSAPLLESSPVLVRTFCVSVILLVSSWWPAPILVSFAFCFASQGCEFFVGEMSSESEKDKERLSQAAKVFFFHIRDLASFINKFVELFNLTMKTQVLPVDLKEDCCIKDFFEQMITNFKEMQLMVEAKHKQGQKRPLCCTVATAVTSAVEKCANVSPHHTVREMLRNIQVPAAASVLSSSLVLGSLESSFSNLMQFPIMGLRLCDFYREETKEQSGATTSEKITSPECPKATPEDALKKLQDALRTEDAHKPEEAAADELEQFVQTMELTLQVLQKAIETMEGGITIFREAGTK